MTNQSIQVCETRPISCCQKHVDPAADLALPEGVPDPKPVGLALQSQDMVQAGEEEGVDVFGLVGPADDTANTDEERLELAEYDFTHNQV